MFTSIWIVQHSTLVTTIPIWATTLHQTCFKSPSTSHVPLGHVIGYRLQKMQLHITKPLMKVLGT